jgi:hypothetical protein
MAGRKKKVAATAVKIEGRPELLTFREDGGDYIAEVFDEGEKISPWPEGHRTRWAVVRGGVPHGFFANADDKLALAHARGFGVPGCSLYKGVAKRASDSSTVYKFQMEL